MRKEAIIFGANSDIYKSIKPMLAVDYSLQEWTRDTPEKYPRRYYPQWDLVVCFIGSVAPVGHWSKHSHKDWEAAIESNLLLPIRLLRDVWHNVRPDASVCFMAGANPNRAGINYSAYYTGKMALLKAIENIDAETPEAKFFALAPGIVFTKIHQPTYDSGIPNQGLIEREKIGGTPPQKIYDCLKWCIDQPKSVVGGRNICVSDKRDALRLETYPSLWKLRRVE